MFEQCLSSVLDKTNKWHLTNHIWSLNLNLRFKPTPFNVLLVALAQITAYWHVMIMHHIVHCIDCVFFCVAGICPLSIDMVSTMSLMTTIRAITVFRSASQAPPIEHSYTIPLSCSALFYCIRTTMIQLLHVAVVEPLILCMTCHCHSK